MRLCRVGLFYAFLLHFCNKGIKERGRPTIARPSIMATGCGQGPFKGGHTWPRLLARAVACGQPARGDARPRPTYKERHLLVARPRGQPRPPMRCRL
ncbi:hypothetical protein B296_00043565 [Ensete ventricosum]|uniref:Secreted protein n=1 Tax=Ensete ventricosum TaxID=4639 RepID=A0A426X6F2_ENSVE|nr:hypothetical protein B296_00043565 [Ensete ventricosum]